MSSTSDIVQLLLRQGDVQAEGSLRDAQIRANESQRKQALWTAIIGKAADVALNLPLHIQTYKENALKLRALRSSMQQDEDIGAILKKHQQLYALELQARQRPTQSFWPGGVAPGMVTPKLAAPPPVSGMSLADISKMASSFGAMPPGGGMP